MQGGLGPLTPAAPSSWSSHHRAPRSPLPSKRTPSPGMQLIVHSLGGEVREAHAGGEYGRMPMKVERDSTLFSGEESDSQLVSHPPPPPRRPRGGALIWKRAAPSQQQAWRAGRPHLLTPAPSKPNQRCG